MATLIDLTYDVESASDSSRIDRVTDIIDRLRLGLHAKVCGIKYSNSLINALFYKTIFLNVRGDVTLRYILLLRAMSFSLT